MNKVTLSVLFFGLGACCTLVTSRCFVATQPVHAQIISRVSVPRVPPITESNPVPLVPPFPPVVTQHNQFTWTGDKPERLQLDGLISENNVYNATHGLTFVYGGGAYSLLNARISGQLSFEFVGAAANTVALLDSLGVLVHGGQTNPNPAALPKPQQMNKPKQHKVTLRKPLQGDIASVYNVYSGNEPH